MKIAKVYVRFFRSFNFDYLKKFHDGYVPDPWDDFNGVPYPYVVVPIDNQITTVVGSNESGKSHLLSAIEKLLGAKSILPKDICRYSQFFSVQRKRNAHPQFGGEFQSLTEDERERLATVLSRENAGLSSFKFFRLAPDAGKVYLPNADGSPIEIELDGELLTRFSDEILPLPFRIDPDIALPASVPIGWLADPNTAATRGLYSREQRARIFDRIPDLDSNSVENAQVFQAHAPNLFNAFSPLFKEMTRKIENEEEKRASFVLARDLLINVADVDPDKLKQLSDAVAKGDEGYANALVQKINEQLDQHLNFSKWWVQDKSFQLRLDLREIDLVFVIRDRTGSDFTFDERSSGLRYFLSYYVQRKSHVAHESKSEVLLMDEPDAYLSADAQQDLLRILSSFAYPKDEERPIQVVYVTHSPFLIDKNHAERVRVLRKGNEREGTVVVSNVTHNHYEPLRSALGTFVGETAFISNCNIVLEGQCDQLLLAGLSSLLNQYEDCAESEVLDLNSVTLVPAGSASHVPYIVYLIRGRDRDKPATLVLLDSDQQGDDAAKLLRSGGPRAQRLIKPDYILQIGDIENLNFSSKANFELDDIIPIELAVRGADRYFAAVAEYLSIEPPEITAGKLTEAISNGKNLFDALKEVVSSNQSEASWRIDKVGFCKCAIEVCEEELEKEEPSAWLKEFFENGKKLFIRLNSARRMAEREKSKLKIEDKVDRLKKIFTKDHSASATKEEVLYFFEELEEALDDSNEADIIKTQIAELKRSYKLAENMAEKISDYRQLVTELDKFKYLSDLEKKATLQAE